MAAKDLIGRKFGLLLVLRLMPNQKWLCRCQCGKMKSIPEKQLMRKNGTSSCGCLQKLRARDFFLQKLKARDLNLKCNKPKNPESKMAEEPTKQCTFCTRKGIYVIAIEKHEPIFGCYKHLKALKDLGSQSKIRGRVLKNKEGFRVSASSSPLELLRVREVL